MSAESILLAVIVKPKLGQGLQETRQTIEDALADLKDYEIKVDILGGMWSCPAK